MTRAALTMTRVTGDENSIRAAGRGNNKKPSVPKCSEGLSRNSTSSLAVFYVEQVALNRHVSPQPQLHCLCLSHQPMSRARLAPESVGISGIGGAQMLRPCSGDFYLSVEFLASSSDMVSVFGPMKRVAR